MSSMKRSVMTALLCALMATPVIAAAAEAPQVIRKVDEQKVLGRWLRTDGGYILELKEGKDGVLKAAYFNPRPINVSKAELGRDSGKITVFVELRDTNYPGSYYQLTYDNKSDTLAGTYFQAALKETYAIEFIRKK